MSIEIKQIGITSFQQGTWGRVYIDYVEGGQEKFAFKNWLEFVEKNFSGSGSFESEPAYTWFSSMETTEDYMAVLEGEYDDLYLTPERHKLKYGTPSKILMTLIQDIDSNLMQDINNRRGWFNK